VRQKIEYLQFTQVAGMRIQEVVKDEEWQKLRRSLIDTWKTRALENCRRFREYVLRTGEFKTEYPEAPHFDDADPLRIRRVRNYLTGTGFRTKTITHPEIDVLLQELNHTWTTALAREKEERRW